MTPQTGPLRWPEPLPGHGAVHLRPWRDDDLDLVQAMSTDPYVPSIGTVPAPYTTAEGRAYIARQHARLADGAGYSVVFTRTGDGVAVGSGGVWLAERPYGRAAVGYGLDPRHRGHGYATDALRALTALAWRLPDLHRLQLLVEPWNTGSIRVAERAGFSREGLLRSWTEISGRRCDLLMFARLRTDP